MGEPIGRSAFISSQLFARDNHLTHPGAPPLPKNRVLSAQKKSIHNIQAYVMCQDVICFESRDTSVQLHHPFPDSSPVLLSRRRGRRHEKAPRRRVAPPNSLSTRYH